MELGIPVVHIHLRIALIICLFPRRTLSQHVQGEAAVKLLRSLLADGWQVQDKLPLVLVGLVASTGVVLVPQLAPLALSRGGGGAMAGVAVLVVR